MPLGPKDKLKHWCGFPAIFGLDAAPTLGFDGLRPA